MKKENAGFGNENEEGSEGIMNVDDEKEVDNVENMKDEISDEPKKSNNSDGINYTTYKLSVRNIYYPF